MGTSTRLLINYRTVIRRSTCSHSVWNIRTVVLLIPLFWISITISFQVRSYWRWERRTSRAGVKDSWATARSASTPPTTSSWLLPDVPPSVVIKPMVQLCKMPGPVESWMCWHVDTPSMKPDRNTYHWVVFFSDWGSEEKSSEVCGPEQTPDSKKHGHICKLRFVPFISDETFIELDLDFAFLLAANHLCWSGC